MPPGYNHRLPDIERSGGVQIVEPERDIGAVAFARLHPGKRAFVHQNLRCHLMRAEHTEALLLDQPRPARQQIIVAATEGGRDTRQQLQRRQIEADLPEGRSHQRSDQYHLMAAGGAGRAREGAKLRDADPGMWPLRIVLRPRNALQRKQQNMSAARAYRIRNRQRQAAAAANQRERALLAHGRRGAHASSSASTRLIAMVSGRVPARMKSIILRTCASFPSSAATRSSRARNSPSPKNSTR